MATFNSSPNTLNNSVRSTEGFQSTAAYFVPSPSPLLRQNSSSFSGTSSAIENHSYIGIQKNLLNATHHVNSSSSYTFTEIKREPCQVSEVTTSNGLQSSHQHNSKSTSSAMVKLESTSPKMSEMEKMVSQMSTNNSVPVGIAVARKRQPETTVHTTSMQPTRDMNYFGIRVTDIGGGATAGCGNIYFAGTDLLSGANTEDIGAGIQNVNRSASTFWQYPNTFPIESVISMSPVGLQYSRDASRGQLVLLPATAAIDSFQQAAFLWPPYMQQNSGGALQSASNIIFPSMSPQTSTQSQPFAAPIQFLGSNYITAGGTAATSTLCQHSQTNGNRIVSVATDTKRLEQSQKHSAMKIEDWSSEHNVLSKTNLLSHNTTAVDKSEIQANTDFIGSMSILPHEQPHILLHNTHSQSEFINMQIHPPSLIQSPDKKPFSPPRMTPEIVGGMYKTSALKASFLNTPEMQDVNIQTDTPACSEDENYLEVSAAETMSYNVQLSERNKSVSHLTSVQYHNNYGGAKTLQKDNFSNSLPLHGTSNAYSEENTHCVPISDTQPSGSEFISNRSVNKNEFFNSDSLIVLPSADRGEISSYKINNSSLLEMSGLELLSNISTGTFVNHNTLKTVRVKQEPFEIVENEHRNEGLNNNEIYSNSMDNFNTQYPHSTDESEVQNKMNNSAQSCEQSLGGLNLLCALAEQRIQEEVESNNYNNSINEQNSQVKRRKHKHSKPKSSRKARYYKKNKKKYAKERKECLKASGLKSDCKDTHENLRNAFRKVDSNYKKLNKWPNPEDFFKAMESDMRMRLADITRQYRKKKRKLDEISRIKKKKKTSSSEYKFANISCNNPNFICFLDKFQSTSSNFPSPSEHSESRHKTLHNKNNLECAVESSKNYEEVHLGDDVYPSKFTTRTSPHNSIVSDKFRCKENRDKNSRKHGPEANINMRSNILASECQKHATVLSAENKVAMEINKELVLSNEHLYRKETRVLTDMGGLFYAGILKPLQPPDVYAITLDGERGNKSHIMSREEIFKDTILEVAPQSIENVPIGTRLCAYWSQQYRCLYPGKAIDSEISDIGSDFVSVEFDDGDSGRIRLQNIRFLLSDYPIVEYSENPFNSLGKNKRSANIKSTPTEPTLKEMRKTFFEECNHELYAAQIDKTKQHFDKKLSRTINIPECVHKHRKHKKRRKHKKHHRESSLKLSTAAIDNGDKEDYKPIQEVEEINFDRNEISNNQERESNCESETYRDEALQNIGACTSLKQTTELEAKGLNNNDSTSSFVSEVFDEAKHNEKVDYRSGKGSKIAAFLPKRQLWGWLGQAYRRAGLKGRARKQFYKSITRGKETITVGECAVFLSTGRPDRPYIGRIEAMWETTSSNKVVRVRWFYHPEETIGCPVLKYPGALFDSPHEDENDVQTISHRCEVIEFSVYIAKFGTDTKQYQAIYDNNDTYYLSGYYNPRLQVLKMQPDIPTKENINA